MESHNDWIIDIYKSRTNEDEIIERIKSKIITHYNVERKIAGLIALEFFDIMNATDVNLVALRKYILH